MLMPARKRRVMVRAWLQGGFKKGAATVTLAFGVPDARIGPELGMVSRQTHAIKPGGERSIIAVYEL